MLGAERDVISRKERDHRSLTEARPNIAYFVYMMTNRPSGTLYVGVTNDPAKRANQHRLDKSNSFVSRYKLHTMVWAKSFDDVEDAIVFEKRLKRWRRDWKIQLIDEANPKWESIV